MKKIYCELISGGCNIRESKILRKMRIVALLLLISITQTLALGSYAQTKQLSLNCRNETILNILDKIEDLSEFYFMFDATIIDVNQRKSINCENQPITAILDQLLEDTKIVYEISDRQIVLTTAQKAEAGQQLTVSGKVTDSSGSPLPGVTVVVKGTTQGTITDADGKYSLPNVPSDGTLVFSFVGMKTQEVPVAGKTNINVTMSEETIGIEEIVAIGYGTQKKASLTGSISTVNVESIKSRQASNISQLLQGAAAGVNVTYSNLPGSSAKIRIHGLGTINNNDPLWVVDGVPGGSTSQLNPDDIESITILKDAASTAIYGSRGASGVILVTTKQGKIDQPLKVQFSSRIGVVKNSAQYDVCNTEEYMEMLWMEAENSGIAPSNEQFGSGATPVMPKYLYPTGAMTADLSLYDQETYPITEANQEGTDWYNLIYNNGLTQDYNISLSGGSKKTTYSFGAGVLREEGIVKFTGFDRYTLRSNISSQVNDWLEIGENMRLAYTNDYGLQSTGENGMVSRMSTLLPIMPVYDVMGNFAPLSRLIGISTLTNPYADMVRGQDFTSKNLGARGNVYAKITLFKGLSIKTLYGYGLSHTIGKEPLEANPESYVARSENELTMTAAKGFSWNWTNTINYSKVFADIHSVNLLLGSEAINSKSESFTATRTGYLLTSEEYWVLDAGTLDQLNTGAGSEVASYSLFGRINYELLNKYLLDATFRRDGSSRFGKDYRYGTFPSVAAGWRISEESFMDATRNWLDYLKIRVSWGISGNDQVGSYNGFTTMGSSYRNSYYPITGSNDSPSVGFQSTAFGNPNAKWEKTISKTVGIDGEIFSRLGFSLDIWEKTTNDMLYKVGIPAVEGQATVPSVNIGAMKNHGVDLQLNYRGTALNKDLSYSVNFNISHYKNKLSKISDNANEVIQGSLYRLYRYTQSTKGTSFPEFFGYDVVGIFQSDDEANNYYPQFDGAYNRAGVFKFRDVNGDEVIDSKDRTYIGNPHPDFVSGLTANIRYKQFDLSASFYASVGNDIVDIQRLFLDFNYYQQNRSTKRLYKSWGSPYLKDNKDAEMPIAESNDAYSQQPSTYFVEDGSYLRLEDIQIGYNFPKKVTNYIGLSNIRVYVMASNVFTITKYEGLDPQISTSDANFGIDLASWPTPKRFMLGINVDL